MKLYNPGQSGPDYFFLFFTVKAMLPLLKSNIW